MSKRLTVALLACTSVLFACGPAKKVQVVPHPAAATSPTNSAPTNATQRSLGVYVADVTMNKDGIVSTSVRPLGSDLSAAATRGISGLDIKATSTSVLTSSAGNKHYTAALTITNNSGKDITLPTFAPISINNAKPFVNVKNKSGGTIASNDVRISNFQAYRMSGANVEVDPLATQYSMSHLGRFISRPHHLKASDFTVPAGKIITNVLADAWLSSPIASGATQNIQLGFIVNNPDIFSFSLIFGVVDGVYQTRTSPTQPAGYPWYNASLRAPVPVERKILSLINKARSEGKCGQAPAGPLVWDDKLGHAALNHSVDMAERKFETSDDPSGIQAPNRILGTGYNLRLGVENLAIGSTAVAGTPEQVVAGWLGNSVYCANIMRNDILEAGVGYVVKDGKHYWTLELTDQHSLVIGR